MAIEQERDFWSMLSGGFGQGFDTGTQNYWRQKQLADEQDARKRAERMQGFQMVNQMYNVGQVSPQLMNTAAQGMQDVLPFLKEAKFAETPAWLRTQITSQPQQTAPAGVPGMGTVPSLPRFSPQQYEAAGLKSPIERERERKATDLAQRKGEMEIPMMQAQTAVAQNQADPQNLALGNYTQRAQAFGQFSKSAANEAISRIGGVERLTSQGIKTLPDEAFKEIERLGILDQFGKLDTAQKATVKGMIADEINNNYLEWYRAQSERINAQANRSRQAPIDSSWDKMHDNLMKQIDTAKQSRATLKAEMGNFGEMYISGVLTDKMLPGMTQTMPELPANLTKWKKQWEDLSKHETRLAEIANKIQGQKMAQTLGTPVTGNALTVGDIQYLTGGMSQSPADAQTTAAQQGTITAPVQEEVVEASPTDFTRLMTRVRGLPRNQQQSFIDNIPVLHPRDKAKALKQLGFK